MVRMVYSYVVARDFGFAPNPFFGTCTLATCKPDIRKAAGVGEWVIGTGSEALGRGGCLVFAMKVSQVMSFDDYWNDERHQAKKANLAASRKQAFGDNIYHRDAGGAWLQLNSHHSRPDGSRNRNNVDRDTGVNRVLLSDRFSYFGATGPAIPPRLDIVKRGPGHRCRFSEVLRNQAANWLCSLDPGFHGQPGGWARMSWTPWHALG